MSTLEAPDGFALNPLERFIHDLHERCHGTGIFTCVTRLQGRLEPEPLRRVLAAVQRRHPLLRACLTKADGVWRFRLVEPAPPIPVEWIETDDVERWRHEMLTRPREMFAADRAPLMRVTVLQPAAGSWCDLLLTVHHVIGDGQGITLLLREMLALWPQAQTDEPKVEPFPWVAPHIAPLPRQPGAWRARRLARLEQRRLRREHPLIELPLVESPPMSTTRLVFTAEASDQLRDRCRTEETSMYGALAAAALQELAGSTQRGGRLWPIRSPIDLRELCQPKLKSDQLGCHVWILGYDIAAPERQEFWELARQARGKLEAARGDGGLERSWKWLPWVLSVLHAGRLERLRGRRHPMVVSVNIAGLVRGPRQTKELRFEAMSWYSNRERSSPTFVVNAALVEGRLCVTFNSPCHTPETLETFARGFEARLHGV